MPKEIERKFLVSGLILTDENIDCGSKLTQGYLPTVGVTVRIRLEEALGDTIGDSKRAYITVKGPADVSGLSRDEYEYLIPFDHAQEMLKLCVASLTKIRYHLVAPDGHTWSVDYFEGPLSGLVMAEVELENANEKVDIPSWAFKEVTHDKAYTNLSLAHHQAVPE